MAHGGPGLEVNVSRLLAPVTTLGPGRRVGMWVQGCRIACRGCASVDTWDAAGGRALPVTGLADLVVTELVAHNLRSLTITGGEPTDQGEALATVVDLVRNAMEVPWVDVLLFTGRALPAARRLAPRLVDQADYVISGPYRDDLPSTDPLLSSSNQTLTFGSDQARERYYAWCAESPAALQMAADGRDLYLVGLPRAGDLDEFRQRLAARGIEFEGGVSWQR